MSQSLSAPTMLLAAALVIFGLCLTSVGATTGHGHGHGHNHGNHHGHHNHGNNHGHHNHHHDPTTTTAAPSGEGCEEDEYRCQGAGGACIPVLWRCDLDADCPLQDDEADCTATCSEHDFTCRSGVCIPGSWRCDGDTDCQDNSDETACNPALQVNSNHGNGSPNSRVARHAAQPENLISLSKK